MAHSLKINQIKITVASAGTAVTISSTKKPTPLFIVSADSKNKGNIYVGNSSVAAATNIPRGPGSMSTYQASSRGDATMGDYFDLAEWFIDADNNDDFAIIEFFVQGTS